MFWSAMAERSGDTAFAFAKTNRKPKTFTIPKRRAPNAFGVPAAVQNVCVLVHIQINRIVVITTSMSLMPIKGMMTPPRP
jgi:hypothetical protein